MANLVNPTGVTRPPERRLAPRLKGLAGARLGLLDNAKPNADLLLTAVSERLQEAEGVLEVVRFRKQNPGLGAASEVLDELAKCDAVLLGTSD